MNNVLHSYFQLVCGIIIYTVNKAAMVVGINNNGGGYKQDFQSQYQTPYILPIFILPSYLVQQWLFGETCQYPRLHVRYFMRLMKLC